MTLCSCRASRGLSFQIRITIRTSAITTLTSSSSRFTDANKLAVRARDLELKYSGKRQLASCNQSEGHCSTQQSPYTRKTISIDRRRARACPRSRIPVVSSYVFVCGCMCVLHADVCCFAVAIVNLVIAALTQHYFTNQETNNEH